MMEKEAKRLYIIGLTSTTGDWKIQKNNVWCHNFIWNKDQVLAL